MCTSKLAQFQPLWPPRWSTKKRLSFSWAWHFGNDDRIRHNHEAKVKHAPTPFRTSKVVCGVSYLISDNNNLGSTHERPLKCFQALTWVPHSASPRNAGRRAKLAQLGRKATSLGRGRLRTRCSSAGPAHHPWTKLFLGIDYCGGGGAATRHFNVSTRHQGWIW